MAETTPSTMVDGSNVTPEWQVVVQQAKKTAKKQQVKADQQADQQASSEQEDSEQAHEASDKQQEQGKNPQQADILGHWDDDSDEEAAAYLLMPTRQHEPHRPRLEETTVDFFSNWMKLSLREQMLRIKVSVRLNQELRRWGRWANIELNTGINAATKLERERDVLKLSVEESNKAAEASIVQATELVEKLKASTNLTAGEVKPVVDGVVELQEGHRLNQSARELREHFARREQEILAREMAVDAIAQEAALEAAYQAYHLAMIATATSGNITAYECGPVVLKEADGSSSANLDHPFWKGRALGSWLMNNAKLGSGDWYGADDLTGQHPLSLRHPHGRNQPWGYFTGISHALRGMEEPDLSDIPDPKTPWNYQ